MVAVAAVGAAPNAEAPEPGIFKPSADAGSYHAPSATLALRLAGAALQALARPMTADDSSVDARNAAWRAAVGRIARELLVDDRLLALLTDPILMEATGTELRGMYCFEVEPDVDNKKLVAQSPAMSAQDRQPHAQPYPDTEMGRAAPSPSRDEVSEQQRLLETSAYERNSSLNSNVCTESTDCPVGSSAIRSKDRSKAMFAACVRRSSPRPLVTTSRRIAARKSS